MTRSSILSYRAARAAVAAAAVVLALVAVAPAPASALPDPLAAPEPCAVPDFIPNQQMVVAAPGEFVNVAFRVDEPTTGYFWAEVAFRWATSATMQPYYGFAAERAMPVGFVESATGDVVGGPLSFTLYPYGIQLDVADVDVRLSAQDGAVCGGAAAGDRLTLAPGDYRMIVFGATELGGESAALLPDGVTVTGVTRGPAHRLAEPEMDCAVNSRATAAGFASQALVSCATPIAFEGRGYFGLGVSHFPDATHQVMWRAPDGALTNVVFGSFGVREPGSTWTLLVPKYVSPASHPFYVPVNGGPIVNGLSGEGGIFGAWADVA